MELEAVSLIYVRGTKAPVEYWVASMRSVAWSSAASVVEIAVVRVDGGFGDADMRTFGYRMGLV